MEIQRLPTPVRRSSHMTRTDVSVAFGKASVFLVQRDNACVLSFGSAGVGGNLVAIQASRISTFLHFWSMPGVLPHKMRQHWPNPCTTFFASGRRPLVPCYLHTRTLEFQKVLYWEYVPINHM